MTNVVDLDGRRPHTVEHVECLTRDHRWIAVFPIGAVAANVNELECSKCHAKNSGIVRFLDAARVPQEMEKSMEQESNKSTEPAPIRNTVTDPDTGLVSEPLADNIFVPVGDKYTRVSAALSVAISTCSLLPGSREVSLVKTKLEEAAMWLAKAPNPWAPLGS